MIQKDLEELKSRPGVLQELQMYEGIAQRLGYQRGGRTTLDVVDELRKDVGQTARELLQKIPTPGGEWKPEVTRTPEERAKKAEEIKKKLEKSEEVLQCEEDLIKAAAKVKSRTG